MIGPLHHLHIRKRMFQRLEDFPHPQRYKRFLDSLIYAAGIAGPVITIPQIVQIWSKQDASDLSLFSWGGFLFLSFIWLLYGIAHKEKPLIYTFVANIIVQSIIVIEILVF